MYLFKCEMPWDKVQTTPITQLHTNLRSNDLTKSPQIIYEKEEERFKTMLEKEMQF